MEDFFKNAMSLFENKDVWQKARYIFEYEASSASDDTQSVVLRLQGISDFPLIQLLRKTGYLKTEGFSHTEKMPFRDSAFTRHLQVTGSFQGG